MITVQDVLPTLLAALNLDTPDDLDGGNRWPLLNGEEQSNPLPYVTMGQDGTQAYYLWPWKLIALEDAHELYNLESDPTELSNVAADNPEQVQALSAALEAHPRADNLHIPIYRVFWDPDFFGGEEDREPWADIIEAEDG